MVPSPTMSAASASAASSSSAASATTAFASCPIPARRGPADDGENSAEVVRHGNTVLLVMSDEKRMFVEAGAKGAQKFGKISCSTNGILGQRFGSIFEVTRKGLVLVEDSDSMTRAEESSALLSANAAEASDNRDLVDRNTSQKLSADEIEAMKAEGASGKDIIQALVQNSETWSNKTQFSQQKYLAQKEKKHAPRVRLLRCDVASVCETYFLKNTEKVNNLRPDSLAQVLAYSNVYAGCQALVFDTCMGVVVAACADRLDGGCRETKSHRSPPAVRRPPPPPLLPILTPPYCNQTVTAPPPRPH